MNLNQIPRELKELPNWVVADGQTLPNGKRSKVPLNPKNGYKASSDDPETWASFEEAISSGFPILGFVPTKDDPFTIIDLDTPETPEEIAIAERIIAAFKGTYMETSLSTKGVHIIGIDRNKASRRATRRGKVEVYPFGQYIIQTGDWMEGSSPTITDCTDLFDSLYAEMPAGAKRTELVQVDSGIEDEKILQMARRAANAEKFNQLWRGEWKGKKEYPSASEADFALLGMIVFYTPDDAQTRRIFRESVLGQREKHVGNDYHIDLALAKLRSAQPPRVDVKELLARMEVTANEPPAPIKPGPFTFPPGLIGKMAAYGFSSAVRPVAEIQLAAALGLMAGITGRTYNVSDTGLNLYLLLVAKTGTGKEGAASTIDSLISAARTEVPAIGNFMGPASFASGQALTKYLSKNPCFISPMGEIGLLLKEMCSPNTSSNLLMLRRALLDCYGKSGHAKTLQPSVYANTESDVPSIFSPCPSIMGDTTPETIYESWSQAVLSEGFVSRWQTIEHHGGRPPLNPNRGHEVDPDTLAHLVALAKYVLMEKERPSWIPVTENPDAAKMLAAFNVEADTHINASLMDVSRQIWNRAHLKVLKLAALVAVGCDHINPVIEPEHADWAMNLVRDDVTRMHTRFASGDIGLGDSKREADFLRAMKAWGELSNETKRGYGVSEKVIQSRLVPVRYLLKRCRPLASFTGHRMESTKAFELTVENLEKQQIIEIPAQSDLLREFGTQIQLIGEGVNFAG